MADAVGENAVFNAGVLDDTQNPLVGGASGKRRARAETAAPSSSQMSPRKETPMSVRPGATPRTNMGIRPGQMPGKTTNSPGRRAPPTGTSTLARKEGRVSAAKTRASNENIGPDTAAGPEANAQTGGAFPSAAAAIAAAAAASEAAARACAAAVNARRSTSPSVRSAAPGTAGVAETRQQSTATGAPNVPGKRGSAQKTSPRTVTLSERSMDDAQKPSPRVSVQSERSTDEPSVQRQSRRSKTTALESMKSPIDSPRTCTQLESSESSPSQPGAREDAVRVVVRVRPRLKKEQNEPEGLETSPDGRSLTLSNGRDLKRFSVDHVYDSRVDEGSQAEVFASFGNDLVNHSLKGYNVCLFAYGHTGSGKTYTIMGDGVTSVPNLRNRGAGILPRFLHALFEARETRMNLPGSRPWRCTCEYIEVYNETIRDLLSPGKADQRTRRVHVHPKYGVRVDNLSTSVVNSAEEALSLVNFGNQIRTVASTTMNERSSRSHAFFTFKYEQLDEDTKGSKRQNPPIPELRRAATAPAPSNPESGCDGVQSTITFVDLAGREDRAASKNQATTYREMCAINVSLFHLSHLIQKISENGMEKNSLSDFRNSKLTMLLAQALTGNSRTALVATLTPLKCFFEDSCSTMNFATSAKKIETRPVVNNKSTKTMIAELEAEVKRLHRELELQKGDTSEKNAELATAQAMIDHYKRSWEEALRGSEENKEQRERLRNTLGLSPEERGHELPMEPNGCVAPFLTKLSDDPSLQGCCNYFLNQQDLRIGSDVAVCEVVLLGLGIAAEMCALVRDRERGVIEVSLLETDVDAVRVLVSGEMLTHEEPIKEIQHGDSIVLGYSHAFRLVVPTEETMRNAEAIGVITALTLARSSLPKLDISSAVMERISGTDLHDDLYAYVRELTARCSQEIVQSVLRDVGIVRPLLEEANLITKEILGHGDIHFELHALNDVLNYVSNKPEFVVCIVENPRAITKFKHSVEVVSKRFLRGFNTRKAGDSNEGDAVKVNDPESSYVAYKNPLATELGLVDHMHSGTKVDEMLVCVVTMEEFLRRLNAIRDVYQDATDSNEGFSTVRQFLATHPYSNPWHHATFHDIKLLSEVAQTVRTSPVMSWILRKEDVMLRSLETPLGGGSPLVSCASEPSMMAVAGMSMKPLSPPTFVAPKIKISTDDAPDDRMPMGRTRSKLLSPTRAASRNSSRNGSKDASQRPSPNSSKPSSLAMLPIVPIEEARASVADSRPDALRNLAEHWKMMLLRQDFVDVKLVAGDETGSPPIFAHRAALVRLPFFEQLLAAIGSQAPRPASEVVVRGVGSEALRRIILYAYTDSTRDAIWGLSTAELEQLSLAAGACGLQELQRACEGGPTSRRGGGTGVGQLLRATSPRSDGMSDSEASHSPRIPYLPSGDDATVVMVDPPPHEEKDRLIAQLREQLEAAATIRDEALDTCRKEYEDKLKAQQDQAEHDRLDQQRMSAELADEFETRKQEWAEDRAKMKMLEEALQNQIAENTEIRVALWNTQQQAEALIDVSDPALEAPQENDGLLDEEVQLQDADACADGASLTTGIVPELQPEDFPLHGATDAPEYLSPHEVVRELEEALEAQKAQLAALKRNAAAAHVYEEEHAPEPEVVWRPRRTVGGSQSAPSSAPEQRGMLEAPTAMQPLARAHPVEAPDIEQEEIPNGTATVVDAFQTRVADAAARAAREETARLGAGVESSSQLQMLRLDLLQQLKEEIQAELCSLVPDPRQRAGSDDAEDSTASAAAAAAADAAAAAESRAASAEAAASAAAASAAAASAAMQPGNTAVLSTVASEVAELVQKLRSDLRKTMKDEIQDQLMHELHQAPCPATAASATPGASSRTTAATSPPAPAMEEKIVPSSSSVAKVAVVPSIRPLRSASVGSPGEWRTGGGGSGGASPRAWSPEVFGYYRGQVPSAQLSPRQPVTVRRHFTAGSIARTGSSSGPLLAPLSGAGSPREAATPTRAISNSGSAVLITPPQPPLQQPWPPPQQPRPLVSEGAGLMSSAPSAMQLLPPPGSVTLPVMTALQNLPKPPSRIGASVVPPGLLGMGLSPRGPVPPIPPEPVAARQPDGASLAAPPWCGAYASPPRSIAPPMALPATTPISSTVRDSSRRQSPALSRAVSPAPAQSPAPGRRVLMGPFPRVMWEYYEATEASSAQPIPSAVRVPSAEPLALRR